MKKYTVKLIVDQANISTVLAALDGSATLLSVEPIDEQAQEAKQSSSRYANGRHIKDISGEDLVLKTLADMPNGVNMDAMRRVFVRNGFAPASANSTTSKMVNAQTIKRLVDGRFVRNG